MTLVPEGYVDLPLSSFFTGIATPEEARLVISCSRAGNTECDAGGVVDWGENGRRHVLYGGRARKNGREAVAASQAAGAGPGGGEKAISLLHFPRRKKAEHKVPTFIDSSGSCGHGARAWSVLRSHRDGVPRGT